MKAKDSSPSIFDRLCCGVPLLTVFFLFFFRADIYSAYCDGRWTHVGRESTKHPNVLGVYVPKDQVQKALIDKFGSQAGVSQAAADALKNIMRNGTTSTKDTKAYGIVTEFKLDNGIGARFYARTNEFIGFLGRGL